MSWSISLGRIASTAVRIHLTFFLLLLWIGADAFAEGGIILAATSIAFLLLLFLCVLLHEFGHILAARRFGIRTPEVVLLPIGGVSRLERIPERPSEELIMALAGPAVSLGISLLLFAALGGPTPPVEIFSQLSFRGLVGQLAYANLALFLFNMLPAFPMDGGRVLRAILAAKLGHGRGTRIAASIGRAAAVILGIAGIASGNVLVVIIAFFIYAAAGIEAKLAQVRSITLGIPAGEVMITDFETLSADAPLTDAAEALLRTSQRDFPVLDSRGAPAGVLTRDSLIRALGEGVEARRIADVMSDVLVTVSQWDHLDGVLERLEGGAPMIAVTGPGNCLVGIITWENLLEDLLVAQARGRKPRVAARPALAG